MTRYLVARCLRRGAPNRPYPYSIGEVELRSAASDSEAERTAIASSLVAFAEVAVEPDLLAARASIIVDAKGDGDAFTNAAPRLDEALDVLASANSMPAFSSYRLMEAGYASDLATGRIAPRIPTASAYEMNPWTSTFLMDQYDWQPRDLAQHVLSTERGELGDRYRRAAHWSRKADLESNPHLAMLFDWFAAESVWNVERDDNIIPAIRWSLGFPNGHGSLLLSPATQRAVAADSLHRPWSGRVEGQLQRIRIIRNQTVHNGFRQIDVPADELKTLRFLAGIVARYALHCVRHGIYARIRTVAELIEYLPLLLESDLCSTFRHVIKRLLEGDPR